MSEQHSLTALEDAVLICVLASQERINHAIAELERDGYITRSATKQKQYLLNPNFDWLLRAKDGRLTVVGPMDRPV